jgi:hypothetical protein
MNKLVRDGLIAVIVSPGHGAGWYSWHGIEELLFDPSIVAWIESNERDIPEDRFKFNKIDRSVN